MTHVNKTLILLVAFFVMDGCAGAQKELLEADYLHMTNDELLTYHDNLSAEIARCEGDRDRASVGVGTGYGSGGVGVSIGLSHRITTCNPEKLIQRRNDVRVELNRRGFKP